MTDLTANTLRTWAGDAAAGQAVEIDAAKLRQIADALEYPQCGGAAQTLLAMLGDKPELLVEREYIISAAMDSLQKQQRLNASESRIRDLERELEGLRGKTKPVAYDRREAA